MLKVKSLKVTEGVESHEISKCCIMCWIWYCHFDKTVNTSTAVCIQRLKEIVYHRYLNVRQLYVLDDLASHS